MPMADGRGSPIAHPAPALLWRRVTLTPTGLRSWLHVAAVERTGVARRGKTGRSERKERRTASAGGTNE